MRVRHLSITKYLPCLTFKPLESGLCEGVGSRLGCCVLAERVRSWAEDQAAAKEARWLELRQDVAARFQALVHVFRGDHALAPDLADADFAAWCASMLREDRPSSLVQSMATA